MASNKEDLKSNKEDLKSIQADVASFVSGLGFSTASVNGDGFYDADFRKKGRISDKKPQKVPLTTQENSSSEKPSELKQANKKSKILTNKSITSELHQSPMKSNGKLEKTSLKQSSSKQEKSELTEKPKFQQRKGSRELDKDDLKKNKKKQKEEEDKAEKFSPDKKHKARASVSLGITEKQKVEKKTNVFGSADFKKKRTTEKMDSNTIASAKKQKAEEAQVFVEKDQNLLAKMDSARDGSKTLSKIWSLLKSGRWYEASSSLNSRHKSSGSLEGGDKKSGKLCNGIEWSALVAKARRKGEELMDRAAAEYEKSRGKDSDMRWLMVARKTGTTADKVAAFTVLLQDNAIANLKSLDALLGMVTSKGGKRHAAMGIDALKELFVASLLPDRKLKYLMQQPLQVQPGTHEAEELLFLWYWEDCLKQRYEQFVGSLEEATKDNLPFLKEKAVKTLYELLKSKPEQERKLLSALVNKLGDPERKVASNAGYYLSCLLTAHPNMKMVVVQEVDFFLFRPHLGLRSRYQAVVFLNQIVLSNKGDGPKLAKRLIDIYFSLFKVITAGKPSNNQEKGKGNANGTQQRNKKRNEDEDDAVVEIDSRLLSALLTGVNRAFPFVSAEDVDTLIEEHTPVLFRLVHSKSFNVGVQALILLYQLLAKNNAVSDRLYRALYGVLLSPGLSKSSKMEMFLGLVFKATKSDINSKRMAAFSKRLMQVALQGAPQFACGCLLLLSEILKSRPTLWHAVTQPEDADEEIEHFEDFKEEDTTNDDTARPDQLNSSAILSSSEAIDNEEVAIALAGWPKEGQYNPRHRDPSFCNADQACWWELTALASHAHPSVAAMAKTLLSGASILYAGDPLRDLAFSVFLDRFTEKKPKSRRKSETWHGSSLSAPAKKASLMTTLPIGDEFLKLSEKEVAPEDVVFHKFYTSKVDRKQKSSKAEKRKEEDVSITGEGDLLGDNSDDDEIDDLLDQDEGVEMGMDDPSEDENESEGEWTYHEPDGGLEDANGEHNSSDEDVVDFEDINGASSDEDILSVDLNEHTFEEGMDEVKESQSLIKTDSKKHPKERSTSNKREKKRKEKIAFNKDSSSKSPFADLDEYSHLLEDERPEKDKIDAVPSMRKRKRAK